MEQERYNPDTDWEMEMPMRLLYVFVMLVAATVFIGNPMLFADIDEIPPLSHLYMIFIVTGSIRLIYKAWWRVKNKRTKGAFMVLDYGMLIAGGLVYSSLLVNMLRFYF